MGNKKLSRIIIFTAGFIIFIAICAGIGFIQFLMEKHPSSQTTTPTTVAKTITATPTPTLSQLDQDKQAIEAMALQVIKKNYPGMKTPPTHPNYSSLNWTEQEPLIKDVEYDANGNLSLWFYAWSTGDTYMDVSDYNNTEMEMVEIVYDLSTLKLNTPLTKIAVAAYAPLENTSCTNTTIDRMALISLPSSLLSKVTFSQWGNLNGDGMFSQLQSLGITQETNKAYLICNK